MSNSIRVSLLVLVAVCLNLKSAVCGDSATSSHGNVQNISADVKSYNISISNDLPPGPPKLFLVFADFQKNEVEIDGGSPYSTWVGEGDHTGELRWKQCADISVIPALEQSHQLIFWSVREDGLYHSWDNTTWDIREVWGPC